MAQIMMLLLQANSATDGELAPEEMVTRINAMIENEKITVRVRELFSAAQVLDDERERVKVMELPPVSGAVCQKDILPA